MPLVFSEWNRICDKAAISLILLEVTVVLISSYLVHELKSSLQFAMAGIRRPTLSQSWEEDECLEYYGMLSMHQIFDIIGSQLTENDIEALSFLVNESHPFTHPLDPQLWTVEDESGNEAPDSALLAAWQRRNRRCVPNEDSSYYLDSPDSIRPKSGTELLLELERRGKFDEGNFTQLLQLLRILTRHDLLPYVSMKRPRTVSPERFTYGPSVIDSQKQMDGCLSTAPSETREENWETGSNSNKRKRGGPKKRGRCPNPKRKCSTPPQTQTTPNKVTCGVLSKG